MCEKQINPVGCKRSLAKLSVKPESDSKDKFIGVGSGACRGHRMIESNTPILVGCGQVTLRNEEKRSVSCLSELVQDAVQKAAVDTGLGAGLFEHVDGLACVHGMQVGAQSCNNVSAVIIAKISIVTV